MSDDRHPVVIEIGWICVDCADPSSLAAWWQAMVGGETSVDDDGDVRLEGGPLPILFLRVPDQKQVKNRLHFDLRVDDYEAAIARAIDHGAEPADDIFAGERWRVLRDPEGNEFCIIRPKHETG
jgi:predicted enzyme related to lactoylglutathione lyase